MSNDLLSPIEIVRSGLCIGCGSCVAQNGGSSGKMKFDRYGQLKPASANGWLSHKSLQFAQTCPFSPVARREDELASELFPATRQQDQAIGHFETAYVGYVAEEDYRMQGSSGGMVSWVATELLKNGLIDGVAHVVPVHNPQAEKRYFRYRISRTEEEVREGAKSRYYPIELSEVLDTIRNVPGRYAVVGIPCFIKAVQLLRREDPKYRDRIRYTLGLFCGHMKSARFIESFAWQMGVSSSDIKQVEFRYKDAERPANWYNARLTLKDGSSVNKDWWHLADGDWGAGFFMNSACNYCDDVVAETADISFGDAWVEPYSSDGRGTNVVLIRSEEVAALVSSAIQKKRLMLDPVDRDFVVETQAAGLRQRREGLAYRLTWPHRGVQPQKRVGPAIDKPPAQRQLIYRIRYHISAWSHRMFRLARWCGMPQLYIRWARMAAAVYHGLAYHRGKLGKVVKKLRIE